MMVLLVPLGPQPPQPAVSFTTVPIWGQDGVIAGTVSTGSQPLNLYIFAFVPDVGWTGLPSLCSPVPIQQGRFSIGAAPNLIQRNATRFSAYLTPAVQCNGYNPVETVPFIVEHNAVASVTIPRLSQYSTISFAGMQWFVKDAPVPVSPGPQFFVKDNVFVDSFGQLHLRITRCGTSWCAAEVFTKDTIGYGSYRFDIATPVSGIDPNLTLGLFSWDAQAHDQNYREWDFEFSRWGSPSLPTNAQFVVQPYNIGGNMQRFQINQAMPSSNVLNWSPSQISFTSSAGGNIIRQWNFFSGATPVPTPGDVHLHLNFYVFAGPGPSVPANQEIVISGLQYTPAAAQIGFARTAETLSFDGRSYTAPLTSSASNCFVSVESDAPWLSVTSNRVPPGLPLQYTVSENGTNQARTGNLILQSSNCNVTVGSQVFAITQNNLVCAPVFAPLSTHFGALPANFSIDVKGTYASCGWSVSSSASWLRITSPTSGAGDGTVLVSADANTGSRLRGTALSLDNGALHSIYQDGAGVYFALSPRTGSGCGAQSTPFGLSWSAPAPVEIRLNSPTGSVFGQFGPAGTTTLSAVQDGALIFLLDNTGNVLASARASVAPDCPVARIAPLGVVNAASYSANSLAPGSLAAIFGSGLSATTAQASGTTYPTTLGGVTVNLAGQSCPLWYVSPGQINFAVPANIPPGRYTITAGNASSEVILTGVSPGIFTVKGDGTGVPMASLTAVLEDGTPLPLVPYQCFQSGCIGASMALPDRIADLYITLYGTGLRNYRNVTATLGSYPADVQYLGAQSQFPGLDQVNLHLKAPAGLSGSQPLSLQADGIASNTVQLIFR